MLPRSWLDRARTREGNVGLSVKKQREYTRGLGKTWKEALNPPRQKAVDRVRGRVGLRFSEIPGLGGEERWEWGVLGPVLERGSVWILLSDCVQGPNKPPEPPFAPLLSRPNQPASVSSVRLKHETKTKHSSYTRTRGRDSEKRTRFKP